MLCASGLDGIKDERVKNLFLPVMEVTIETVSNLFLSSCMIEKFNEQRIWRSSFTLMVLPVFIRLALHMIFFLIKNCFYSIFFVL